MDSGELGVGLWKRGLGDEEVGLWKRGLGEEEVGGGSGTWWKRWLGEEQPGRWWKQELACWRRSR